ncbi:hypothetical protein E2F47_14105 [Mycobacterium eburneum]|nr:hypothetical protein E2F47_14105 [Mycobacterium eburneum]
MADEAEAADDADIVEPAPTGPGRRFPWSRLLARAVLPGLALIVAVGCGYLKWWDESARVGQTVAAQSVHAATDSTIAILSYRPDTVATALPAAADRLTGTFRDQYTQLINDVVVPGAQQQRISAAATVPAAASVSASSTHAVVLVFVNQTTTIGDDPPTNTASSVRVTLDKVHGRWLISQFEPV